MNDNQYFFFIVLVTSNICQRDSCREAFTSKKRVYLLATSYVRRTELQKRHGSDVQAPWCLLVQRSKRKANDSKKQSLVVLPFDHDIPPSTLGQNAGILCLYNWGIKGEASNAWDSCPVKAVHAIVSGDETYPTGTNLNASESIWTISLITNCY